PQHGHSGSHEHGQAQVSEVVAVVAVPIVPGRLRRPGGLEKPRGPGRPGRPGIAGNAGRSGVYGLAGLRTGRRWRVVRAERVDLLVTVVTGDRRLGCHAATGVRAAGIHRVGEQVVHADEAEQQRREQEHFPAPGPVRPGSVRPVPPRAHHRRRCYRDGGNRPASSTPLSVPGALRCCVMQRVVVIGGGILGLAVAHELTGRGADVTVLEKESHWARHQTGHNSNVVHAGLYYKPGSHKARMSVAGNRSIIAFAEEHGVPAQVCGKLVVATDAAERGPLRTLAERAQANGVPARLIGPAEAREYEPNVSCVEALRVESTGIIDFPAVCEALARVSAKAGAELRTGTRATAIRPTPGE